MNVPTRPEILAKLMHDQKAPFDRMSGLLQALQYSGELEEDQQKALDLLNTEIDKGRTKANRIVELTTLLLHEIKPEQYSDELNQKLIDLTT